MRRASKPRKRSGSRVPEHHVSGEPSRSLRETPSRQPCCWIGQQRLAALRDEPPCRPRWPWRLGARLELGQLAQAESLLAFAASEPGGIRVRRAATLLTQHRTGHTWIKVAGVHEGRLSLSPRASTPPCWRRRPGRPRPERSRQHGRARRATTRPPRPTIARHSPSDVAFRERRRRGVGASLNNVGRALHSLGALNRAAVLPGCRCDQRGGVRLDAPRNVDYAPQPRLICSQYRNACRSRFSAPEVLRIDRAVMPKEHPRIAEDLNDWVCSPGARRYAEAEAHFVRL